MICAACCDGVNEKSPNLIVRCLGWDAASYAIRFAPGMISGTQQLIPWRGSEAGNVIPLGQPSTPSSHTPWVSEFAKSMLLDCYRRGHIAF